MHEAALRAMKQSLTASFRHFFGKKNGGEGVGRHRMIYSAYFTLKDLEYQHSIPGFI
jgi:hypothetical protein